LTGKNEKKFVKVSVSEDSQKARNGFSSPSESSSLSEVLDFAEQFTTNHKSYCSF